MGADEKELVYTLALNSVPGVGGVTYRKLIERFGNAEAVFKAGRKKLDEIPRMTRETKDTILSLKPEEVGKKELDEVTKRGFGIIVFGRAGYPKLLAAIHDPPPVLYVAGSLKESDELAVAIVGSRDPTGYGRRAATKLAGDLSNAGVTIVSGMARGIDSAAHRGAINAKGRTIAVLGNGLDIIYPSENRELFDDIVKSGAVISPFPMGAKPEKGNFPARNRVISGMSLGVVVVQATTPDSGSLITARHALEQGREVFAVPGEVGIKVSQGTNTLIKKGNAKLIENFADVLEEILPQFDTSKVKTDSVEQATRPAPKLDGDEKTVWENLEDSASHIDIVARKCNLPVHRVAAALLQLELKGLVEQQPGKMFLRAHR